MFVCMIKVEDPVIDDCLWFKLSRQQAKMDEMRKAHVVIC